MKILMFSINPIFPGRVTGGASKHLFHIARHMGEIGHQVEILCARPRDLDESFLWSDGVKVLPVLPFHLPFPQPYAVSGADLGLMVERLSQALESADRFYIHDSEWLIPDVYEGVPTTTSFRDNIYPESVLGSFLTKADEVICISNYSAEVILATAGKFFPDMRKRLNLVNNGIDFTVFNKKDPTRLAKSLGVDPKKHKILLHPHRPEEGKGLEQTIRVTDQLIHKYGWKNIKVIIPQWIDEMVSAGESSFYHHMNQLMEELEVKNSFIYMPWLPNERMPELFSLGDVTLCLGSFVETFGNVAYESLACGTPSVVAKVGVHRTLMPDHLIDKVRYNDIDGTAERINTILQNDEPLDKEVLNYLENNLNFSEQVKSYAKIITQSQKRHPLSFDSLKVDSQTSFTVAPWCYFEGDQIFHDYKSTFEDAKSLKQLLEKNGIVSQQEAHNHGVSEAVWNTWIDKTWIVPTSSR